MDGNLGEKWEKKKKKDEGGVKDGDKGGEALSAPEMPMVLAAVAADMPKMAKPKRKVKVAHGNTSSVVSTSEDEGKRFKPGTPLAAAKNLTRSSEVVATDSDNEAVNRSRPRNRKRTMSGGLEATISKMKGVTSNMLVACMSNKLGVEVTKTLLDFAGKYEEILMNLVGENERLRGKLEVYETRGVGGGVTPVVKAPLVPMAPVALPAAKFPALPKTAVAATPAVTKVTHTWSTMVKGKGVPAKDVVKKVVEEVGPTLGVRVHSVKPTRDGGAVIRTPSVAERKKVVENTKFAELGLEVSVQEKLGPKVMVNRVHAQIGQEEFMEELYKMNFSKMMSKEAFTKSVRMVTAPWKADGGPINVVLECTKQVMDVLTADGAYVKWFRFTVRPYDDVMTCYKCHSYDHRYKECRMAGRICRRCGIGGHNASLCPNPCRCRNCEFKGLRADHMMLSASCPLYSAMVERAKARH